MLNSGPQPIANKPSLGAEHGLIDIHIRSSGERSHVGRAILVAVGGFVSMIAVVLLIAGGFAIIGILLGLFVLGLIIYMIRQRDRKDDRQARREALFYPRKSETAKAIYDAAERGSFWDRESTRSSLARTVQHLAKLGQTGQTIRFHWSEHMPRLNPMGESFEPKILDESAPSFMEFRCATSGNDLASVDRVLTSSTWRVFKRNATANGRSFGLLLLGVISFMRYGVAKYTGRRETFMFAFYCAIAAIVVFGLLRPSGLSKEQWYFVPGGLLRRSARRGECFVLRMFAQKSSLLALYQRDRSSWIVSVADITDADTFAITTMEMEMLLRAWLSPLEPPPVESLVDYQ